jgi:micrococcal nuclease
MGLAKHVRRCWQYFRRTRAPIRPEDVPINIQNGLKLEWYVPKPTTGLVIKVYDGDTLTIASHYHGANYRFSVRLKGIDAPELRASTPAERDAAWAAQKALYKLAFGANVELCEHGRDKYGRTLAVVIETESRINLNEYMLENGYAKLYNGGRR